VERARALCAAALRENGLEVRDHAFEYSAFPGRFATPLLGAAAALLVGVSGTLAVTPAAFALLAAGAVAMYLAARWLTRRGVLSSPVLRACGVNLVATRPGAAPRVWLSAHVDTKSQPVPTLARTMGLVLEGVGYGLALVAAALSLAGSSPHAMLWTFAAVVTLVGAVPVMLSIVTNRSPGALDNASGVATVVEAARMLAGANVGVLVTDAEELGLAGARAWTRSVQVGGATVLNCDGVDDSGRVTVMYSGSRPGALLAAVETASRNAGVAHEAVRLLPGVLTDSVAFADAGAASVTFSRGSIWSLARVHSRRDDLSRLRGTGIAQTASLMAETARALGVD